MYEPRHLLSAEQFLDPAFDQRIDQRAYEFRSGLCKNRLQYRNLLADRFMVGLYYAESTRTRVSFRMAAWNCGMDSETCVGTQLSEAAKGEPAEHTAKIIAGYNPDVIVVRSDQRGGAALMAKWSSRPIINAADKFGEHPTQAKLDKFTMLNEKKGGLGGMSIIVGGDLEGRAVRSLLILLAPLKPRLILVSAPELRITPDMRERLDAAGCPYEEEPDLKKALPDARIIYWTRTQNEQRTSEEIQRLRYVDPLKYQIRTEHMDRTPDDCILMHPLPICREPGKVTEVVPELDHHPKTAFWRQAENGIPIRMAILEWACENR